MALCGTAVSAVKTRAGRPCHTLRHGLLGSFVALGLLALATSQALAEGIGNVTLLVGTPTMLGQTFRPFDPVLTGNPLETDPGDAAGICTEHGVLHIGPGSQVVFQEDAGAVRASLEHGYVVIYVDPQAGKSVVLETPFGKLTAAPAAGGETPGWFSVRHEPEQPAVKPAESIFGSVEGTARAEGTSPVTEPHQLTTGQEWRIVRGQVPGEPQAADTRSAAEELRDMLHSGASDLLRAHTGDDMRLAATTPPGTAIGGVEMTQIVVPEQQLIVDNNDAFLSTNPELPGPVVIPTPLRDPRLRDPQPYPAGQALTVMAQYLGYGDNPPNYVAPPASPAWTDQGLPTISINGGEGVPAYQPDYIDALPNAGFSYLQFVGDNADVVTDVNGEVFFVGGSTAPSGWAFFTPQIAVADTGYSPAAGLAAVVSDGFMAVATGAYLSDLPGGDPTRAGTLGGTGAPGSAFVEVGPNGLQFAENLPVGYPLLSASGDATGLAEGGILANDQLAALGTGLNPQDFSQPGDRLLFISNANQDGQGYTVNLDGQPIQPTYLGVPADRAGDVVTDNTGFAALGNPLDGAAGSTVGIQFVATGDVLAIIHHAGQQSAAGEPTRLSDHFEVERGDRYSIIRWVDRESVGNVELEDLNSNPAVRNEFFVALCREINRLAPTGAHTACGPARTGTGGTTARATLSASAAHRVPGKVRLAAQSSTSVGRAAGATADREIAKPRVVRDRGVRSPSPARVGGTRAMRGK